MNAPRKNQVGFTLLEMLIALLVFGLLMAGLSQTMRYGMTAWTAETRNATAPADAAAVDGALRRIIEQANPVAGFTGRPNGFACTTSLPIGSSLANRLADAAVLIAPGGRLILRWTPHPAGIPLNGPALPQTELLMDGVAALHVSYLARHPNGPPNGPPTWTQSWTGGGLPLLVRVSVQFTGKRTWPDLVAAPVAPGAGFPPVPVTAH